MYNHHTHQSHHHFHPSSSSLPESNGTTSSSHGFPHHHHHINHHHLTSHQLQTSSSTSSASSSSSNGTASSSASSTTGVTTHQIGRKKRRGMIEKRRRDRINNSLNELRRLVPAAFEKQGSAKLEKAEILQMTVDHLTMLHAKGFDAFSFDPHKFAMDYHSIGFRECASEVARYLVAIEGMDLQDPLRLRLMSHLQCYATQRELSLKSSAAGVSPAWNPAAFTTPHQFAPPGQLPTQGDSSSSSTWNPPHPDHSWTMMGPPPPPPPLFKSSGSPPPTPTSSTSSSSSATSTSPSYTMSSATSAYGQYFSSAPGQTASSASALQASVKSFRPWGGELVY